MLRFVIMNGKDDIGLREVYSEKIIRTVDNLCNIKNCADKKIFIYMPERVLDGYGAEFIPINAKNFYTRFIDYANKEGYEIKNIYVVRDIKSLKQLLTAFHKLQKVGCVIGILESLMEYIYASKRRTDLNRKKNVSKERRNHAKGELYKLQSKILTEISALNMFDVPTILLWLGYDFTYVNKGEREKKKKVFLYTLIKDLSGSSLIFV